MKLDYRRDIHRQYMILTPEEGCPGKPYQLRMLAENEMPGFVSCTCEHLNGLPMLYYDVTGMKPLTRYLQEKPADARLYRRLAAALLSCMETLGEYLLDPEHLLMMPEAVFVEEASEEIRFVCCPFPEGDPGEQPKALAGLLLSMVTKEPEDMKMAYRFCSACGTGVIDTESLKALIREPEMPEPEAFHDAAEEYQTGLQQEAARMPPLLERLKTLLPGGKRPGGKTRPGKRPEEKTSPATEMVFADEREESVPDGTMPDNGYDETTLLGGTLTETGGTEAWLVPADVFSGESIALKGSRCIIGRGIAPGVTDIGIRAVSRKHAALVRRSGSYELSDLGSRNGTCVNGRRLISGEAVLLSDGDVLKFADAEYHFCLTDKD